MIRVIVKHVILFDSKFFYAQNQSRIEQKTLKKYSGQTTQNQPTVQCVTFYDFTVRAPVIFYALDLLLLYNFLCISTVGCAGGFCLTAGNSGLLAMLATRQENFGVTEPRRCQLDRVQQGWPPHKGLTHH